jgi:hypothetical protein
MPNLRGLQFYNVSNFLKNQKHHKIKYPSPTWSTVQHRIFLSRIWIPICDSLRKGRLSVFKWIHVILWITVLADVWLCTHMRKWGGKVIPRPEVKFLVILCMCINLKSCHLRLTLGRAPSMHTYNRDIEKSSGHMSNMSHGQILSSTSGEPEFLRNSSLKRSPPITPKPLKKILSVPLHGKMTRMLGSYL